VEFRTISQLDPSLVDALIVPVDDDGAAPPALPADERRLAEWVARESGPRKVFTATTHLRQAGDGALRLIVVAAGRRDAYDIERARKAVSAGVRTLWHSTTRRLAVVLDETALDPGAAARAAVEGVLYAMWRPDAHRSGADERRLPPLEEIQLLAADESSDLSEAIARGQAVGEAVNFARRLANEPACKVDRARGGDGYDLGLVGKGITFDTGGISIKPAEDMHVMKYDMTGAASVIAAIGAIARLRLPLNVIAVAPCTENMPGGRATKPGDVVTSMSGKTVEVINTDAEGRLVLIDGLTYAQREGAQRLVDVATLTGGIKIALGTHYTGVFGRPDGFVDQVVAAGRAAGERMWHMPLSDEYRDDMKGEVADLKNSSSRWGSSIKGAAFVEAVVDEEAEWAHLDIAGSAWFDEERPFTPKGPQGASVRTLIALAQRIANRS